MDFAGAAAEVDVSSFFPKVKVDVEPNVPNPELPNDDEIFGLDVAFPNTPAGAGPDPVAGEPAGVVENRFVGVPKAAVVLGVVVPLAALLVVEVPISGCFPKAPLKVDVDPKGASGGLAAASFSPKADVGVASFLVSLVTVVEGDEAAAVVGAPNMNLGLVSVVAEAPADGCPNENLGKVDAGCVAAFVVDAEGVAEKEKMGVDGFGSDDGVVPAVGAVEKAAVTEVAPGTAGKGALANEDTPGVVGLAKGFFGVSAVVGTVPPESG